jgi:hypothetical protein
MEVVERRVVVELERVCALGQSAAIELLAVRVLEADREVVVHVSRQDGKVVRRDTELPRRVGLPDAADVHVRPAHLARHVDVAAGVLTEGRDEVELEAGCRVTLRVGDLEHVRPDVRVAVVAVDVATEEARDFLVADDIAAGDRAASRAVRVLQDRHDGIQRRRVTRRVDVTALVAVPAEVDASAPADVDRLIVELLVLVLADVPNVQRVGHPVEREPPRVAKPVRPDLRKRTCLSGERVVRRNRVRVRPRLARIDAQKLSEKDVEALGVVQLIAPTPAVAGADVEHPVGAELQLAPVVVRLARMQNREHRAPRAGVADIGISGVAEELVDLDRPVRASRVIDVKPSARRIVRGEGHRQEPALTAGGDPRDHHEQTDCAVLVELNRPALLDDKESAGRSAPGSERE